MVSDTQSKLDDIQSGESLSEQVVQQLKESGILNQGGGDKK
jgi:hypothetical protein